MSIFAKIHNRLRRYLGIPLPRMHMNLLDKTYYVRKGTISTGTDKDDAWLLACAAHSHIAFDIGSNVGQSAVLILYPDTVERIVLVEANPEALSIAADNLIQNHLINKAQLVCAFASSETDAMIQFWTVGTGAAGSQFSSHAKTAARQNQSIEVATITIDILCTQYALTPDLIKVDVEGAEADVLRGAIECARQKQTRFFVEMHSNPDLPMQVNAESVLSWCQENDYRAWYLAEHVLLESSQQIAHRGRCHLLLQPSEWIYPEWLQSIQQGDPLERVKLA